MAVRGSRTGRSWPSCVGRIRRQPRRWTLVVRPGAHAREWRSSPVLVEVGLDAVPEAGDEVVKQLGAQSNLRAAAAVGAGACTVHDLVANDSQVREDVIQRARSFSIVQSSHCVPDSTLEFTVPLCHACRLLFRPIPKGTVRLAKFQQLDDRFAMLAQNLLEPDCVVPRCLEVERFASLAFRGIWRIAVFYLVGRLVRDPVEDKPNVGAIVVIGCLPGEVDPYVHARGATLVVAATRFVNGHDCRQMEGPIQSSEWSLTKEGRCLPSQKYSALNRSICLILSISVRSWRAVATFRTRDFASASVRRSTR